MHSAQNPPEESSALPLASTRVPKSPPPPSGQSTTSASEPPLSPRAPVVLSPFLASLPPPRPTETPARRQSTSSGHRFGSDPVAIGSNSPPLHGPFGSAASLALAATSPPGGLHQTSPPVRKDTASSISTQATTATVASTETSNSSYSADTSPTLHQSIFSVKDGSDVSNTDRASRRRTGPLSQHSRERAALIRKLGACHDCRRRRVACNPGHHSMTWEDLVKKYTRASSPSVQIQDLASPPPMPVKNPRAVTLSLSPVLNAANTAIASNEPHEMDIDSVSPTQSHHHLHQHHQQPSHYSDHQHHHHAAHHQGHTGRTPLADSRMRTPLPSGPRLEKSLSLPGIETLKQELQTNVSRMLSGASRTRYNAVNVLLLYWQDDDDPGIISGAVKDLADVLEKTYHYTFNMQAIPPSADGFQSSSRWLSRQINDFADDRDHREVLKIVYYAGYSFLDSNRQMLLASSRDRNRSTTIRWSGIQQILEEACSDTLLLMDAAFFPSSTMSRQRGILEIIAASTSEDQFKQLERGFFTRTIAELLRAQATRVAPLSATDLHAILCAAYSKKVRDPFPEKETIASFPAPLHVMMSGNSRLPSIFLGPAYLSAPLRNSFTHENSPQLHLDIRLNDDNVDMESWLEWLRLMPEGARDVKIEGPFRHSFR